VINLDVYVDADAADDVDAASLNLYLNLLVKENFDKRVLNDEIYNYLIHNDRLKKNTRNKAKKNEA